VRWDSSVPRPKAATSGWACLRSTVEAPPLNMQFENCRRCIVPRGEGPPLDCTSQNGQDGELEGVSICRDSHTRWAQCAITGVR